MSEAAKMLVAFDRFKAQVDSAYEAARESLEAGRYAEAQEILARIAQVHAKTSLSLRGYLIRTNRLPKED